MMTSPIKKLLSSPPTVVPFRRPIRLACEKCGAETHAACDCGVAYTAAAARAADAIAANPEKSDRAIAAAIGVGRETVRRARKATAPHGAVEKRIGLDGKARKLPSLYAIGTGSDDEWYTPIRYLKMAREVLGDFDTCPASSKFAQQRFDFGPKCQHFTKQTNGLSKPWHGRVWLNPPYSKPNPAKFVDKLIAEFSAGRVTEAILLTNAYPANKWFQKAGQGATAICFPQQKINFERQGAATPDSQWFGQAFFYFGRNPTRFFKTFGSLGLCVEVRR